jgi:DNA-binding LytR/AlgR family response regulator
MNDAISTVAVDDDEHLNGAVKRAKTVVQSGSAGKEHSGQSSLPSLVTDPTRLLLGKGGGVVVLSLADIEYLQAHSRHVRIFAGGRCYVCSQSLGELEKRLATGSFVRIHRSAMINIQHLVEMQPTFQGDYEIRLKRGTRLTLSRRYRDRLTPFILGRTRLT